MQRQGRLGYIVAASAISAMQQLVQGGQSPLFLQFEMLEVARFPFDASLALVERVLGTTPAPGVGRRLHEPVSYTHLRAHETVLDLVCRLLLAKQKQ